MKQLILFLFLALTVLSCDKTAIQQTTDNIKSADSLFTKANDGIRTLDSISKTITDSNGIAKKVIIPEIQKQRKSIDSTIKSGGWRIDSINKQIEKITKNVVIGTKVAKTLDSANTSLQKGENALKVLTRTADKLLKQTQRQAENEQPTENVPDKVSKNTAVENAPTPLPTQRNPVVKTASLEIQVEDLGSAKALLRQKMRENNADLVTENFNQNEGIRRERISAKVPLLNFDRLIIDISADLGDIKSKNTETEGTDYVASQLCDVEIVLVQNENITGTGIADESEAAKEPGGFSGAFLKGFNILGDALLFLLPFWPVFLLGGLIWFFIRRNRQKKLREQAAAETRNMADTNPYPAENQTTTVEQPKAQDNSGDGNDHSKYMPK